MRGDFQIKTLDKQGQCNFYQHEAGQLRAPLSSAADPTQVQSRETRINADLAAAFGLLDPLLQTQLLSKFIAAATTLEAAADTITTAAHTQAPAAAT
ncbi:MAG TPA: hypothetical protein VGV08_11425 [Casimicrobiaceae bacterium]|nr:hypothetical protein [Casimicrobiaceae bacterium]